ncbi:uncharacterized protein N7515_002514 [Penicillium bovifimosum]|uniref:Uncharacterized protein n=1 Tax=Penicillium bovifimosum TaxID=126998 RepID=A0A9W9HBR7_9EURO|nr:uncharacterized protein N7515_002514 [Penicillium bovifimosum]KAJ5143727.1 hypothetical protein N7515_002514 [Penicillium bovifimosum]
MDDMEVGPANPNPAKRPLSGQFPSSLPSAAVRDPRLAGPQTSNTQQAYPTAPTNLPSDPRSPVGLPQVAGASLPTKQPTPRNKESQDVSGHQSLSISDLVNSLIKVNKAEEQKERLEKQIASITRNLNRAKQSSQFPSAIAVLQQQLDAAQEELSSHTKSINRNRRISALAQDSFTAILSQAKPQPQLEKMPERIGKLESQLSAVLENSNSTAGREKAQKANTETEGYPVALQGPGRDIGELKERLQKVEDALGNSNKLQEALGYVKKIANSVAHQSKRYGQFTAKISSLENEVSDANKKLEEKVSIVQTMANTIEEEMKHSSEQLEKGISALGSKMTTMNVQIKDKLSSVEGDIRSLEAKDQEPRNVSTSVSDLRSDLEAQRKQAMEAITTQEAHLGDLRKQQQNLDNGEGGLSDVAITSPNGGVLARLASLERKTQAHTTILNGIKELHSQADDVRLIQLEELRKSHNSGQALLESKYDETLQNVERMSKKQSEHDTTMRVLRTDFSGAVRRLQDYVEKEIEGFGTRLNEVSAVTQTVKKCESQVETHSKGIRSLEERWGNITTGDLVNSMARAMHEMYPSVDQLSQQLVAYKSEVELKFSALRASTDTLKATIEKAQANASSARAEADQSRAPQVSPEQHQALDQVATLLQKVNDLSDRLTPIDQLTKGHTTQLNQNLEQLSEIHNKLATHEESIVAMAEKADEQAGRYEEFTESLVKFDALTERFDAHVLELESFRGKIGTTLKGLANASQKRETTVDEDLAKVKEDISQLQALQQEAKSLIKTMKERQEAQAKGAHSLDVVNEHTSRLEKLCKTVEELNQASEKQKAATNVDLNRIKDDVWQLQRVRDQVQRLTRIEEERDATGISWAVIDSLISRLNALERPIASDDGFSNLGGGLEGLERELRDLENEFRGLEESMRVYLRRLRKTEDAANFMKEGTPNNRDAPDRPMGQRIEGQPSLRHSRSDGPPSFSPRSAASPAAFPKGPQLGGYQPLLKVNTRGQFEKPPPKPYPSVRGGRPPPPGPSGSNSSPYKSNPPEFRQGRSSWRPTPPLPADEEEDSIQSSSFSDSSPAPGSSVPPSYPGSGRKDKKRKKRGQISEETARTLKRAKKRKRLPLEDDI